MNRNTFQSWELSRRMLKLICRQISLFTSWSLLTFSPQISRSISRRLRTWIIRKIHTMLIWRSCYSTLTTCGRSLWLRQTASRESLTLTCARLPPGTPLGDKWILAISIASSRRLQPCKLSKLHLATKMSTKSWWQLISTRRTRQI